jgi:hypothetical protein
VPNAEILNGDILSPMQMLRLLTLALTLAATASAEADRLGQGPVGLW